MQQYSGTSVKYSTHKLNGLVLVVVCTSLMAAPAMDSLPGPDMDEDERAFVSAGSEAPDEEKPSQVKPPRDARSRGSELSFLVGLGGLPTGSYEYDTRVTLPGTGKFQYSGRQRAPGFVFFGSGAFTLPRRLRRITVAATINLGGLAWASRPVIPSSVSPPFSKESLYSDIQGRYSSRPGWGIALSSFVEHDIGFFHEKRVRAGYQFWNQSGSYTGSFAATGSGDPANYNGRLSLRSHLLRVSVNEYVDLQDDTERSGRAKRRSGMIQQWGFMLGSHQTIMLFVATGPFWQIAR
jgi:hypothetical protein